MNGMAELLRFCFAAIRGGEVCPGLLSYERGIVCMNETIKTILSRRSIRAYEPRRISDKELETLLECALYAPTGGNLQNSRFLVIQSPALMEELNQVIRDELSARASRPSRRKTTPTAWQTAAWGWKTS